MNDFPFDKILNRLNIKKNDKILVNSNILRLISIFKDKNLPKILLKF